MATKVVIIGHSFIRRLENYVEASDTRGNLGLSNNRFQVSFVHRSGMLLTDLDHYVQELKALCPDAVLIDVGGNDLDNNRRPVSELVQHLAQFCKMLKQTCGIKVVVVLEVPFRRRVCRGNWESVEALNRAISVFNSECKAFCGARGNRQSHTRFCHHVGMVVDWPKYLLPDGVHLNALGMSKYYKSVQSTVIRAASLARNLRE
jgi:lysophospholipase L1-like esterase